MPVDGGVIALVAVRQETVVASLLAAFLRAIGMSEVCSIRREMHDFQGCSCDLGQCIRLGLEPAQDARTSFGGFGEKHPSSGVVIRKGFAGKLGVLELKLRFNATLQRIAQGGRYLRRHVGIHAENQNVAGVLDVGDDFVFRRCIRGVIERVVLGCGVDRVALGKPIPLHGVEPVAKVGGVFAAASSDVGYAYRRGVAVAHC